MGSGVSLRVWTPGKLVRNEDRMLHEDSARNSATAEGEWGLANTRERVVVESDQDGNRDKIASTHSASPAEASATFWPPLYLPTAPGRRAGAHRVHRMKKEKWSSRSTD